MYLDVLQIQSHGPWFQTGSVKNGSLPQREEVREFVCDSKVVAAKKWKKSLYFSSGVPKL